VTEIKVGRTVWIECFDALVSGENEDGDEVAESFGPFRTSEKASSWAQAAYPGLKFVVLPTMEEKAGLRFKGAYKQKKILP